MVTRYRSTRLTEKPTLIEQPATKQELILLTIDALANGDPEHYFSIAQIAERAELPLKTTQAWLAVLRTNNQVDAVLGADGKYWYAPVVG